MNTPNNLSHNASSQRYYRLIGVMLFCVACGLLVVRTVTSLIAEYLTDMQVDIVFSFTLQVGVLVIMPILFYLFVFKMRPREILEFTSIRGTKPVNYVLAVCIGIVGLFVTMGVSTVWQYIITSLGYTSSSSAGEMPEVFSPMFFVISLILSAVLPGFCEEFTMRGGFLTTTRRHFSFTKILIIMGISFGLFHQYVPQLFYTALFGVLMAALVIKSKSIIPSMIVHFFNNGTSVYLESAEAYGWFGGNFYDNLNTLIIDYPAAVFGSYLLIVGVFTGLVFLFFYLNRSSKEERQNRAPVKTAPDIFDRLNGSNNFGNENGASNSTDPFALDENSSTDPFATDENSTQPQSQNQPATALKAYRSPACLYEGESTPTFKPSLRDNIFYIGAAVVAALTTIFSFYWGWIV